MACGVDQRAGADPRREQGLVRIAEGRLGDRHGVLGAQLLGEGLGTELQQPVAGALGQRSVEIQGGQLVRRQRCLGAGTVGTVDGGVRQEVQHPAGLVVRGRGGEQPGVFVDEGRVDPLLLEVRFPQQCAEETDVRRDARYGELGQRTLGAGDRGGEIATATGHLHQHRVEVGGDLAPELRRAVETHACAAR